jgi:GNAT superfamily N-acetyltransferase
MNEMMDMDVELMSRVRLCGPMDAIAGSSAMDQLKQKSRTTSAVRVETVDNWSRAWPAVMAHIVRCGKAKKLVIDLDGWLSARQVVVAAFIGTAVAGHVCFAVEPAKGCVKAQVVSHGIEPRFRDRGIERQLRAAALERAKELNCARTVGFKLTGSWC